MRLVGRFPDAYPGLLESGTSAWGAAGANRFDILPIAVGESLELGADGRLSGPHAGAGGFLDALERWFRALRTPADASPLPFTGGWLLFLGYELAAEIEPSLALPRSPDSISGVAIRTPAGWIRDRATGQSWVVAEAGHEGLLDAFEDHVRAVAGPPGTDQRTAADGSALELTGGGVTVLEDDPELFLTAVTRALEYIAAGDVYQVNLSRQWQVRCERPIDPVALYARLRSTNPSPFAAMMRHRGFSVMSSSPERLLSIRGGIVSTRPIAGTRPRGASAVADEALIESLLSDEKERAEHVMLIDLERNDIGRVCVGGTVRVDEYMALETYAHVHHIVSNVSGRLRDDLSPIQAIRALFPGGTITGCPKVRCMEIIAELEGAGRGAYTGSLGYLNRDGSGDLNILNRTLTAQTEPAAPAPAARAGEAQPPSAKIRFRAGAGIVADSRPSQELAETRAKALGLLRALEPRA